MSSQCWYYSSVHFRTPSSHAFHILFHLTVNNNNIRRIRESSYYCPILILDVLWWPLCHSGYGELASSNIHFLFTKPYTTNTPSFLWNVTCPVYSYHNVNIAGCKWVLIFECSGTTGKYSEARCTCRLSTTPLQNVWELLQCNSLLFNLQSSKTHCFYCWATGVWRRRLLQPLLPSNCQVFPYGASTWV